MKRLILLVILLCLQSRQAQAFLTDSKTIKFTFEIINIADYWDNASGDKDNPFIIQDSAGLDLIRKYLFTLNSDDVEQKYFKLSGDIEYESEDNFIPIGTEEQPFRGVFDGNNYRINGINYSGDSQYVGLFGYVSESSIQNIRLENFAFESNSDGAFVGSIAGFISGDNILDCVVISGSVLAPKGTAGELVGAAGENVLLENCSCFDVDVSGAIIEQYEDTIDVISEDLTSDDRTINFGNTFTISSDEDVKEITETHSSIRTLRIRDNKFLTRLNLSGSTVEIIDVGGCENLEEVNVEECKLLEYLDVSNTKLKTLNLQGCERLRVLICSSCDLVDLNVNGCELLENVDFTNNSLTRFDASMLTHLESLDYENQHLEIMLRAKEFNVLDILFSSSSDVYTNEVANVTELKAFDENGNELEVSYDDETGDVILSEEPSEISYKYITGFKNISMNVKVSMSNGGCNINSLPFLVVVSFCLINFLRARYFRKSSHVSKKLVYFR